MHLKPHQLPVTEDNIKRSPYFSTFKINYSFNFELSTEFTQIMMKA